MSILCRPNPFSDAADASRKRKADPDVPNTLDVAQRHAIGYIYLGQMENALELIAEHDLLLQRPFSERVLKVIVEASATDSIPLLAARGLAVPVDLAAGLFHAELDAREKDPKRASPHDFGWVIRRIPDWRYMHPDRPMNLLAHAIRAKYDNAAMMARLREAFKNRRNFRDSAALQAAFSTQLTRQEIYVAGVDVTSKLHQIIGHEEAPARHSSLSAALARHYQVMGGLCDWLRDWSTGNCPEAYLLDFAQFVVDNPEIDVPASLIVAVKAMRQRHEPDVPTTNARGGRGRPPNAPWTKVLKALLERNPCDAAIESLALLQQSSPATAAVARPAMGKYPRPVSPPSSSDDDSLISMLGERSHLLPPAERPRLVVRGCEVALTEF